MRNGPVLHPLLALRATWVYLVMAAVVARANNLTQALDTLNRQFGMGVFEMGWISKTPCMNSMVFRQCSSSLMSRSFLSMPALH
jgi:hypothetical protein